MSHKQEKEQRREERRRLALEEQNKPARSKKKLAFKVGAAVAFLGIAGTGIEYLHRANHSQDESAIVNNDAVSNEYISFNEATQLYLSLQKQIGEKYQEAKKTNKPFRIFFLENHESSNSIAYELMALDIIKKLGVTTILQEISNENLNPLLNLVNTDVQPDDVKRITHFSHAHENIFLASALRSGFHLVAMDNAFPSANAILARTYALMEQEAGKELAAHYPGHPNALRSIFSPTHDLRVQVDYNPDFINSLPPGSSEELSKLTKTGIDRGIDKVMEERNAVMAKTIKNHAPAMITTGFAHGVGIISSVRQTPGTDMIFAIFGDTPEMADVKRTPDELLAIQWAKNPANAIQHTGKNFAPDNIELFINRVIERAQKSQIRNKV